MRYSSERFRGELDFRLERTQIGKRHLLVVNLPPLRVRHRDRERFTRGKARLPAVQIAGETLQMNDIARLINSAFREEKNGFCFPVTFPAFRNTEAIERHRRVTIAQGDEMPVPCALRENPAGLVRHGQLGVAVLIGHGLTAPYLFGFKIEETELHSCQPLAGRE